MRGLVLILMVLALGLTGCGGDSPPADQGTDGGAGDVSAGKKVFSEIAVPVCSSCHSLEPGVVLAGPSLANIGSEAGNRVSGLSGEEYLRQGVAEPGAYVVEGFAPGIMPAAYGSQLTDQQIDDLVAYLLTLK